MKNVLFILVMVLLVGLVGRMDYQDEVRSAEYDAQMKQEVIKEWQLRCATGDIFDEQVCKSIVK